MSRAIDNRSFHLATLASIAATAFVAAWIGLRPGGATATLWVDDGSGTLAAALACACCVSAFVRHSGPARRFWLLLSLATGLWAVAELIWSVYALGLRETVPSPSIADIGYLLAIPIALAALVVHPSTGGGGRKARSTLDAMALATAVLFLGWTLVIEPLSRSSNMSTLGGVVTIGYPVTDVMLAFFAILTIRRMTGANRRSLWCLLAGLLAMAAFDGIYAYLSEIEHYNSAGANMIDAGWVLAYLAIALSALCSRPDEMEASASMAPEAMPLSSLVAPFVPVLLALVVAAIESQLGRSIDHTAQITLVVLIGLVLLRQTLVLVEMFGPRSNSGDGLLRRLNDSTIGAPVTDRRR